MNDEPSTSATSDTGNARASGNDGSNRVISLQERRQRNRRMFNKKREAFLGDLMRNIDMLIYAELSTIYYMDCSFLRFVLRAFVQFVFLTPKPPIFPDPPQNRPYIGAIFGVNMLCLFFHTWLNRPEAGEATRGYLHGGLAMDFIGQKGPTSKIHLVLLDFVVLALQLIHLSILIAKQRAKEAAEGAGSQHSARTTQNHDFEERGLLRADHDPVDIELQDLNPSGRHEGPEESTEPEGGGGERDALLASTAPASDAHIFDAFNSGEIIIADLNIAETVRTQFLKYRDASSQRDPNAGLASRLSSSGLNPLTFRIRVGNRIWSM